LRKLKKISYDSQRESSSKQQRKNPVQFCTLNFYYSKKLLLF
jgi:hypothetical protein